MVTDYTGSKDGCLPLLLRRAELSGMRRATWSVRLREWFSEIFGRLVG